MIVILNIANILYEPVFFSENGEYTYELKKENRVLRSKLIRTYNKFAHENTNELSFVESENTPTKNDDTNSILDDIDDDTNSILDDIDDIKDIPKIDFKTIELVREEILSTELDYFEMIISEDDIIFEPINDLGEITLTRFNNDAPTVYTRNQTYNEMNELYKFDTKKMSHMNYFTFVNMLFINNSDSINDTNVTSVTKKDLIWTKSVVPVINATKEYITELDDEEEDVTNDHTTINMREFFNERNSKRKVAYNVAKKDIEEANKFLTTVTRDEFIMLRICPTFMDTLISYEHEVLENGSRCMDMKSQVTSNMSASK
jgi:hypothetical protein